MMCILYLVVLMLAREPKTQIAGISVISDQTGLCYSHMPSMRMIYSYQTLVKVRTTPLACRIGWIINISKIKWAEITAAVDMIYQKHYQTAPVNHLVLSHIVANLSFQKVTDYSLVHIYINWVVKQMQMCFHNAPWKQWIIQHFSKIEIKCQKDIECQD